MFKKLKDKIAEELKDGEQRIQQIAQAAQVCLHFAIFTSRGISHPLTTPMTHSSCHSLPGCRELQFSNLQSP